MISVPSYATWYQRLFSYLIDAVIVMIPSALAVALMGGQDSNGMLVAAPESVLVVFLINAAYYIFFTSSHWQATPGMRMFGIRLIRTDGRMLSQRDALERFLALVIPSLPVNSTLLSQEMALNLAACLCIIWFAPILTTRIGLHDRLCSMRVITGRTS